MTKITRTKIFSDHRIIEIDYLSSSEWELFSQLWLSILSLFFPLGTFLELIVIQLGDLLDPNGSRNTQGHLELAMTEPQ